MKKKLSFAEMAAAVGGLKRKLPRPLSIEEIKTVLAGLEYAIQWELEFIRCQEIKHSNPIRYCDPEVVKVSKAFIRKAQRLQAKLRKEFEP